MTRAFYIAGAVLVLCLSLAGCDRAERDGDLEEKSDLDDAVAGATTFLMSEDEVTDAIAAAERGDGRAAFLLFEHYAIAVNEPKLARKWLRRSADLGYRPGQVNLGMDLIRESLDSGSESQAEEGERWLRAAAEAGDDDAARHLAQYQKDPELLR